MKLTISQIARIVDARIVGEEDEVIHDIASFPQAKSGELTFASEPRFLKTIDQSQAGAIIVPTDFDHKVLNQFQGALLKCKNPRVSFFKVVSSIYPKKQITPFVSPDASIGKNVTIGKEVIIHPQVYIGDDVIIGDRVQLFPHVFIGDEVSIGDGSIVKPNVTIMEKSRIGKQVLIHSGTVIGSDGFGFAQQDDVHEKLEHTGYVQIDDHVEIGACNTIDRGTLGKTHIQQGVKTDNLVHIAHNVRVGKNTLLVAQVGIAGSASIGDNVILAGRAGVTGHIHVGDHTIVGPNAGVVSSVPSNQIVSGFPHMPHKKWLKIAAFIPRLLDFRKKILSLEQRVKKIETTRKKSENK